MKKIKWYEVLTPLFLAIFPILSLMNANLEFVTFTAILRTLFISLAVTAVFYAIFFLILRDPLKSGLLSGLLIFLLLTYGNVYLLLTQRAGLAIPHWLLLTIYAVLFLGVGALIAFRVKDVKTLNSAVLMGFLAISVYLLVSIGIYQYRVYHTEAAAADTNNPNASTLSEAELANLPDIYLILVDGHARSDVLRDVYGYDNAAFTGRLEELGFWVADCSTSNYPGTYFSTASMFGMDYLHHIYRDDDNLVFPPLNESTVFQILHDHNYQTVTFQNFVFQHFNINDDIRFAREATLTGSISEFEKLVVDTSILRILTDLNGVFPESWVRPFDDNLLLRHYRDTLYALDTLPTLPTLPALPGNKFVYAHLLVTHDPFVFKADGSFNPTRKINGEEYVESAQFIDSVLPDILAEIIAKSDKPPIIIVMGDHGAIVKGRPIEERMMNLFAIYLQGQDPAAAGFYENVSLVNVFRLLFNDLFDANYGLLDDRSYEIWNNADLADIDALVWPTCSP